MSTPPSLATFPAARAQQRFALALAAGLGVIAAAALPFARTPLPVVAAFLPAFVTFVVLSDLLTALLLLRDAFDTRSPGITVLGCAYLFTGLLMVPHLLAFPGAFGDGTLFGAGSQAAVWLWVDAHAGFPLFALGYALLARSRRRVRTRTIVTAAAATAGLVAVTAAVTFRAGERLPAIMADGHVHAILAWGPAPAVAVLLATSLVVLVTLPSRTTIAPLWLTVACWATLIDVVISAAGGARYSLGWYVARFCALAASSAMLTALVLETSRLVSALGSSERRLRAVVEGVGDALLTVDGDERITGANRAALELFGDELQGRRADDVLRAAGVPLEIGRGEGVLIARDVTERQRAIDEAIEAAAVKSRFLATMSHEIRTPINAVVGTSELLLQTELDNEGRDYAETIRGSAEALLSVVNDILDFSKLEAGATEIEREPFSPLELVESTADILAASARKKGVTLATYVAPDVPRRAMGDAHRVRQVLLNFLSNAVKFTSEGSVVVRAVVETSETPRRAVVRFSVTDTGIGITPEGSAQLFTPFRQVEAGTTRRFGGTGLGLSIAKRLVDLMGGDLGYESVPGHGSTFWFALPLERVEAAPPAHGVDRNPLRGARVLIKGADATTRGVLEQYLLAWGAIATRTSRAAPPDVILVASDKGADLTDVLQRARSHGDASPAVLVAMHDRPGEAEEAAAAGFAGYLRTPLKTAALFDALVAARTGAARPPEPRSVTDAVVGGDLVILVADDNSVNRKLALQQLEKLGYRADAACDGAEAVDAASRRAYDLILMDCEMPVLDGFAATKAIRAAERGSDARATIVALTANALEGDRERCIAAGMDEYLAKPVQLAALRQMLERTARRLTQRVSAVSHT
ncbi:ATP-binding protein [Vulcanimicrobium alpinum]|nr:ATP-binding protein [Vulcanimicrobium alpinum]